jgi:hypothetical protein
MRSLASVAVIAAVMASASTAAARIPIRVGIGDQNAAMFDQSAFQRARFARVRYLVRWNVMDNAPVRLAARAYVQRARAAGMQVLVDVSTDDYRIKRARLPSVATYRRQVGRIVAYFRGLGVREFGTWDEANHASQPTWNGPSHAALFFREMYRAVKARCRTCGVIALDVLDQRGVERFGRSFPCSTTRAASRLSWMFHIARLYRTSGIGRLYVYNWTGGLRGALRRGPHRAERHAAQGLRPAAGGAAELPSLAPLTWPAACPRRRPCARRAGRASW